MSPAPNMHSKDGYICLEENHRQSEERNNARDIKEEGQTYVGKVRYFAQLAVEDKQNPSHKHWKGAAVVQLYSPPDPDFLTLSSYMLASCKLLEEEFTHVVNIKQIVGAVAMIPHQPTLASGEEELRYFMVEKPSMDIATFLGNKEDKGQDEDGMNFPAE
ncbi:hypothetical protein CONPUDRAFT_158793 [Coniophora puteana RWD-64-598 SS2]|uniref:Uncharacterized protein n=1 Tax=Coniophora puteana (strain RWD-64-598) TaxID=741705 RepID=A0A5M3MA87_CONPW|nr:uncharacterized protein CONPUDRAFT_158793 [Coniophora puteana RWD-64-598 SS2]EIW76017.1 hypothetical protein CONPUDRAFT_158793 [Coniophora puteana RWD-64-598 SS2]